MKYSSGIKLGGVVIVIDDRIKIKYEFIVFWY